MLGQSSCYLPEHRELLASATCRELHTIPSLAVEMTAQPVRRYGFDAAPLSVDPLIFLEMVGAEVVFSENRPEVATPLSSRSDLERIGKVSDDHPTIDFMKETTRSAVAELAPVPVIAVCTGPLTMAAHLIEGRPSKDLSRAKGFLYNDITAARALLRRLTDLVTCVLTAQLESGAEAVLVREECCGMISRRDFREIVLPFLSEILKPLEAKRIPAILYVDGVSHLTDLAAESGAELLALDWRTDLELIRARLPENISIQGNLDPAVLLGPPDLIQQQTVEILSHGTLYRGHIFSLGGAIHLETPPECVQSLVDIVRDFDPKLQGWGSLIR